MSVEQSGVTASLPEPVQRVERYLRESGVAARPVLLDKNTRTAQMAADAIGCQLGAIVKSIIFQAGDDLALVMISGDRRVDTAKLARALGAERVKPADADTIKRRTGYVIGGVPPVAHDSAVRLLMDESLFRFGEVWAAAGHQHAVFPIAPADLVRIGRAERVEVAE